MRLCLALLVLCLVAGTAPAAEKWTEYRYPDRGFVISFPAAPQITKRVVEGFDPVTQYNYQMTSANVVFQLTVVEYQSGRGVRGSGVEFLNTLVDRYAKGAGGVAQSQKSVMVAGHPGVEAVIEDKAHARDHLIDLVALGDRVYLVASVGPDGNSDSADAKHFRDSLQLLEP